MYYLGATDTRAVVDFLWRVRGIMSRGAFVAAQLLRSLEGLGYIVRSRAADEGRARVVHFTNRGPSAYSRSQDTLRDIEREWSDELGPERFAQLKELRFRVWDSPLIRASASAHETE